MRAFHDCKDLFKALHDHAVFDDDHPAGKVDWITGHCYTVDMFLWFMAKFGYTLQKNRTKIPFEDLQAFIAQMKDARRNSLREALKAQEQ